LITERDVLAHDFGEVQARLDKALKDLREARAKVKTYEREEALVKKLQGAGLVKQAAQQTSSSTVEI